MKTGDIILLTVVSPGQFAEGLRNQPLAKKLQITAIGKNPGTIIDGDYYDAFIIHNPAQANILTIKIIKEILSKVKEKLGWTGNVDKYFTVNELGEGVKAII